MRVCYIGCLIALIACTQAMAASTVDDLKREVDDLRHTLNQKEDSVPIISRTECACDSRFGPKEKITTGSGKLTVGGLLQIWDMTIDDDHQDVFSDRHGTGGNGDALDNSGTRIRRAEMLFTLDSTENITSVMMMDAAREITSFPPIPSNQGLFKSMPSNPSVATAGGIPVASTIVGRVQTGAGQPNTLLQDAYVNVHGVLPHHDITVGQFTPRIGEEGPRNNACLDFDERAMVTQINEQRDLGLQVHGAWFDDRFQYWEGVFDGAGNFFGTAGQFQNRADDNPQKDIVSTVMVRPFWEICNWGNLELGYSDQSGTHGGTSSRTEDGTNPVNGLNRRRTSSSRQAAWLYWKPMGPVRGAWLRGEWGFQKDRTVPLSVDVYGLGSGPNGEQVAPHPFHRDGFYAAAGYKLTDSVFADRLSQGGFFNNLLQPVEFAFRFESFQNIITEDLVRPDTETNVFRTDVGILGVNYYPVGFNGGYNTRIQVNYMIVNQHQNDINQGFRSFHEVRNNVYMFTYQIMF